MMIIIAIFINHSCFTELVESGWVPKSESSEFWSRNFHRLIIVLLKLLTLNLHLF